MPIFSTITAISGSYSDIAINLFAKRNYLYQSAFFPYRRADLTTCAMIILSSRAIEESVVISSFLAKGMRLPRRFAPRNDVCDNLDS